MDCLCHCGFCDCVCVLGRGVGQTDVVMKSSEIASHHGGVVTKGLETPSDPVRSSHKGRSRKVLKFPGP